MIVSKNDQEELSIIKLCIVLFLVIIPLIWGYYNFLQPRINIWQESMRGQAELAHAEYNRQIMTCEALAKKESAKSLADAEVIRAEGVAKANKIIGDSLENNEGYLRYLYITHLGDTDDKTVIYVPTEAGLPIMESTRLRGQ